MINPVSKKDRWKVRKRRSNRIFGNERLRVVLSKSNRYIRVQAIDDNQKHTLAFSSTQDLVNGHKGFSYKNKNCAKKLAELFAEKLIKINRRSVVFDRNCQKYHGKIKIFCETMRQQGINF